MIKCLASRLDKKEVFVFATEDGMTVIVDLDCYNKFSLAVAAQRMESNVKDRIITRDLVTQKTILFDFQDGRVNINVDGQIANVSVKEALEALQEQINNK